MLCYLYGLRPLLNLAILILQRDRMQGLSGSALKNKLLYKDVAPISPNVAGRGSAGESWKQSLESPTVQPAAPPKGEFVCLLASASGNEDD